MRSRYSGEEAMRILIADDDLTSRDLLETTLTAWGHEVISTQDGDQALDVLTQPHPPSMAVLDWMMPGLDGIDICRELRAASSEWPIYKILLTAKDAKEDIANGLDSGADDYIVKPFSRSELRARIQAGVRIVQLQLDQMRRLRELQEYQAQLIQSARMATLGSLSNGIAHEINNPVFVISGKAQMLLSNPQEHLASPKAVGFLKDIKEMSDRISGITSHLLQYSWNSREMKKVNIAEILEGAITLIGKEICVVELVREYHRSPLVNCMPGRIQQLFINLLRNAVEGMPEGGTITLTTTVESSCAVIGIRDNGVGIPKAVMDRLFEPFVTTKEREDRLVMGVGLYTSYSIVTSHGGDIEIESEPGKGTFVRLRFPLADVNAA